MEQARADIAYGAVDPADRQGADHRPGDSLTDDPRARVGDTALLKTMTKRVGCALRDKREKGVARVVEGGGMYQLWELVR